MASLILDLDQTLIDSSAAANYRQSRQWSQVYSIIPRFVIYEGMQDVFQYIQDQDIPVCIVTTSPESYCRKVLDHWSIPYDHMVCYHDVRYRKPHPESIFKAIQLLKDDPQNILSLGDRVIDVQASKAANIESIGCLWGTDERELIIAADPGYLAETPMDALSIMKAFF